MALVMKTGFSTRCCKRPGPEAIGARAWVGLLLLVLALLAGPARAARLEALRVDQAGDALLLYAQVELELAPAVQDVLRKGIPVHFVAQARIRRERWYWVDEKVVTARRYMRIAYQPLSRRWRVNISSQPIGHAELGLGLNQYHDSLQEALAAVQRIAGWKIAERSALAGGGRQVLEFRYRLDTSQLPRTLQIGSLERADWHWSIEQRLSLGEGGRS